MKSKRSSTNERRGRRRCDHPRRSGWRGYSRGVAKPLREIGRDERYGLALLLLAVVFLIGDVGEWVARIADFIFIAILLMITLQPTVPRWLRVASIISAGVSAVFSITRVATETPLTVGLDALTTMTVVAVTVIAIMFRLIRHSVVTASTVMGAFLAYSLIGFAAAYLYIAVDAFGNEPFFNQGVQPASAYIYFSLVTLTTVGFGDLTPGTELGQRLVVIEALVGQVFLVVLVSRLVSLWQPPHRPSMADDAPSD